MPKLILRLEAEDGKVVEKTIEGTAEIAYILDKAGLLDNEFEELLVDP